MSTKPEIPDDENLFIDLCQILYKPRLWSIGTLATAIERHGIYSWDRFGRYKLFSADSDMGKKALDFLSNVYADDNDHEVSQGYKPHILDHVDHDWPNFGWATGVLPNFDAIAAENFEQPKQPKLQIKTPKENTLLITIAALLTNFPRDKPSGKDLEKAAQTLGLFISDDSIRKALEAARALHN